MIDGPDLATRLGWIGKFDRGEPFIKDQFTEPPEPPPMLSMSTSQVICKVFYWERAEPFITLGNLTVVDNEVQVDRFYEPVGLVSDIPIHIECSPYKDDTTQRREW